MARRRRGGGGGGLAGLAVGILGKLFGCVAAQVEVAKADDSDAIKSKNDYELVVRASKELEHVLEVSLGAQGKGLHEKATSVQRMLSKDLVRKIRYLATIRNKLVHEYRFNSIPDRSTFIRNFVSAREEMRAVVARHGRHSPGQQPDEICKIM